MLTNAANLQPLIVGPILIWAGIWKLMPKASLVASRTILSKLFRKESIVRNLYRLIGIIELLVGLSLLLPPLHLWKMGISVGLAIAFLIFLLVSIKFTPDRPCGCLSGRETAVSWQNIARANLFLVYTILGCLAQDFWLRALISNPLHITLPVMQMLFFLILSPEIDWTWSRYSRFFRKGNSRPETNYGSNKGLMFDSLDCLRKSVPYQKLSRYITSESLIDHWYEGYWCFLCFPAEYEKDGAIAVFAVPFSMQHHLVRAAIVGNDDQVLLESNSLSSSLSLVS